MAAVFLGASLLFSLLYVTIRRHFQATCWLNNANLRKQGTKVLKMPPLGSFCSLSQIKAAHTVKIKDLEESEQSGTSAVTLAKLD